MSAQIQCPDASDILQAVSPLTGIARSVSFISPSDDDPEFWTAICTPSKYEQHMLAGALNLGFACSANRTRAIYKAVGETIERYCGAQLRADQLFVGSANELNTDFAAPSSFALFSQEQYRQQGFRFSPFTQDTSVGWVKSYRLIDGQAVMIPACYIFVPYKRAVGEAYIRDPISTGLSLAASKTEAITKGICEVIERDHFMIYWMQKLHPKKVLIPPGVADEVLDAASRLNISGYSVDLFWLELDSPAIVILAVVKGREGRSLPGVFIGLGCAPSPFVGALAAVEEAALTVMGSLYEATTKGIPTTFLPLDDLQSRRRFYAFSPDSAANIDFLFSSGLDVKITEIGENYDLPHDVWISSVVSHGWANGVNFYMTDLTTPDVAELGLNAVRVTSPEAIPLDINEAFRHLGGDRLYKNYFIENISSSSSLKYNFNSAPHPFP